MKIAILGAMSEEITPLLEAFGDYTSTPHANNTFYFANYAGHELVIAHSKIGKVASAMTATIMIEKYGCEMLLFTGVAGALATELRIKDLLYATATAQHDLDISVFGHPHGFVPGINSAPKTSEKLNQIAISVATKLGISLKSGIIASGDQFICDDAKKSWIKSTFSAAAVEMEGASVGQVCDSLNIPYFLLRAISDEAGGAAEFDFDRFVVESSQISAKFLMAMIGEL